MLVSMFPCLLRRTGFVLLALAAPAAAEAAQANYVRASLVAADSSIQPGGTLTVALRLQHDPGWHTYWKNPGTGLPTSIAWTLPAGFTAGEILWPAPKPIRNAAGDVTGNGYDGDLLLPVLIKAPADLAPGTLVEFKAKADWLMCEEVCIPGTAELTLGLRAAAGPPAADATFGQRLRDVVDGLPREVSEWVVTGVRSGTAIRLTISPADAAAPPAAPGKLHFFAEDPAIAYDQPQAGRALTGGTFQLGIPLAPPLEGTSSPPLARLKGILTAEKGWSPGGLSGLRVDIPLAVAAAGADRPLGLTALLAFLGGMVLNLMPCVFPVLGIKILGFVRQAGDERSRIVRHGLAFTAGVLISFWALAAVLAAIRAGGNQVGWGFQLQSPGFVYGLAALLLVFGLNLSGVFEFGLGATSVGSGLHARAGYPGSFLSGVLATVVATPCSAPFLAPALGAALALPTAQSFLLFTLIALGLSTPYLLFSIFPGAVKLLPRPGVWMETFKQVMAFPLYATVGALLWVLAGQLEDDRLLYAFFGLVVVAMGVWAHGRYRTPGASPGRARFGMGALVILGLLGLWIGWPRPAAAAGSGIVWEEWSPETVAKLRAEGRIVYVDFTARWCATCQANKKLVFRSDDVLQAFADRKVAALRADWTNADPTITAELARYGRSAVPFNLVWVPGKDEPRILPEILRPGIVLEAVGN